MSPWSVGSLSGDAAITEAIAARDHNNLYQASRYLVDRDRYRSFCAFYSVMRVVDDAVDALPARKSLTATAIVAELKKLARWRAATLASVRDIGAADLTVVRLDHPQADALFRELHCASHLFPIARSCWTHFFRSMRRDLRQTRFPTFGDFLRYTDGASVSPTQIFLTLASACPSPHGQYVLRSPRALAAAALHLGRFAYLAHILRDLATDLANPQSPLVYLADDDLLAHGLLLREVIDDVQRGQSRPALRDLVAVLALRSRAELDLGRSALAILGAEIAPPLGAVISYTISMYEEILRRIEEKHDPIQYSARLSAEDQRAIAEKAVIGPRIA